MKKFLIASGVTFLAFATIVGAQTQTFNSNLTVGSTGSEVVALQEVLLNAGYDIPALSSGTATKGYFGSQTKSAVMKYQAENGIPNTGFVGPLTRAALNAGGPVAGGPVVCPAGFTCTQNTPVTVNCPVGYTCTLTGGGTTIPGSVPGISTPGVVGTLAASLWSTPSGIVAYKGQSYDIAAYKVQASASDMALQNLSLDFDVRLWLYASSVTVKDDSGAVVGQVNNLSSSNFSELTVGSQYRLSVPVSNYVVKATQIKYLTVNVTFLSTSDRSTGTVTVTQSQIRSVDGTGVTDTATVTDDRTFTYQGSGAGSIVVTTNSSSPQTGLVQLSTSAQTQNVTLAIFDVKSQNAPSTLRSVSFVVRTAETAKTVDELFSNIKLVAGNQTYSANSITAATTTATVAFTSLSIPLAADTYVPLKVVADVAVDTNGVLDGTAASTTLVAAGTAAGTTNNPVVEDASFSTLDVNEATFASNALTFTSAGLSAGGLAVEYGALNSIADGTTTQTVTFAFSLTAGNNPIYVSRTQGYAIATSSNPTGITVVAKSFTNNDSSGDSTSWFYLAPGQTKSFRASYSASGSISAAGGTFSVSGINFATSTTALATSTLSSSALTNGLQAVLWK